MAYVWPLLAPLLEDIEVCALWVFCRKFNFRQLLFEVFFNIIGTFDSVQLQKNNAPRAANRLKTAPVLGEPSVHSLGLFILTLKQSASFPWQMPVGGNSYILAPRPQWLSCIFFCCLRSLRPFLSPSWKILAQFFFVSPSTKSSPAPPLLYFLRTRDHFSGYLFSYWQDSLRLVLWKTTGNNLSHQEGKFYQDISVERFLTPPIPYFPQPTGAFWDSIIRDNNIQWRVLERKTRTAALSEKFRNPLPSSDYYGRI